jgi:hypothetical protein
MFAKTYFPPTYFARRYFPFDELVPAAETVGFFFKRNMALYISKVDNDSADDTNTVKMLVKDFSFNRQSSMLEIGRNTLDSGQARVINPYVNLVSPIDFTFTTYISPLLDSTVTSPEEYLWISLMGTDTVTSDSSNSVIDFSDGNVRELHNLTFWFNDPNRNEHNFRLNNAVVDKATIDFNVNGHGEIQWQGRALTITEDNTPPTYTDRTTGYDCIKNKLSTIGVQLNTVTYNLALTGGSITFENNSTFYGRTKLGQTTKPLGHYTGNRKVSGNLDFYLKTGTRVSADLFSAILNNVETDTYESTHLANITINVGGTTNSNLQLDFPQVLLGIGRLNFNEVISTSIPFIAKEETGSYSSVTYNI